MPTSPRWWRLPARPGSSWRSTSRSRPRPTTRGFASTRSGSPPARRHAQVRREPAQALPGHPQRRLGHGPARGALECAQGRRARLVRPRHPRFPRRQPAHQADAVLGVADRRRPGPHPEAIFLAEAFTRPAPTTSLAKVGFSQSYTYFAWKNTKAELVEFVEQARSWSATTGRTCGRTRRTSSTSTSSRAAGRRSRPGSFSRRRSRRATGSTRGTRRARTCRCGRGARSTSTRRSTRSRSARSPGPLLPLIRRVNEIRRAHPALQRFESLTWLETHSDDLIAYAKRDGEDVVITVVNLDPAKAQEGLCILPPELGLPDTFTAVDLLADQSYRWRTGRNYVGLPPAARTCSSSATRRHERSRRGRPLPRR